MGFTERSLLLSAREARSITSALIHDLSLEATDRRRSPGVSQSDSSADFFRHRSGKKHLRRALISDSKNRGRFTRRRSPAWITAARGKFVKKCEAFEKFVEEAQSVHRPFWPANFSRYQFALKYVERSPIGIYENHALRRFDPRYHRVR